MIISLPKLCHYLAALYYIFRIKIQPNIVSRPTGIDVKLAPVHVYCKKCCMVGETPEKEPVVVPASFCCAITVSRKMTESSYVMEVFVHFDLENWSQKSLLYSLPFDKY